MPKSKNKRKNGKIVNARAAIVTRPKMRGFRPTISIVDEIHRLPPDVEKWIERYHPYICDTCFLSYEAVDLDEGATPLQGPCLRTEGCTGTAVAFPLEHGPEVRSDDSPVLLEFYKPDNLRTIRYEHPDVISHVIRGGLMRRASKSAPKWVKEMINV